MFSHAPGVIPEASEYKTDVHQFLSRDDSNADTLVPFITFTNVPELGWNKQEHGKKEVIWVSRD